MDFLGWSVDILLVLLGGVALFAMSTVWFVSILYYCFGFLKRRSSDGLACGYVYSSLLYILDAMHSFEFARLMYSFR